MLEQEVKNATHPLFLGSVQQQWAIKTLFLKQFEAYARNQPPFCHYTEDITPSEYWQQLLGDGNRQECSIVAVSSSLYFLDIY